MLIGNGMRIWMGIRTDIGIGVGQCFASKKVFYFMDNIEVGLLISLL